MSAVNNNAIATVSPATVAAELQATYEILNPQSDLVAARKENMDDGETISEQDMLKARMPSGGGTAWQIFDGPNLVDTVPEISGILCYIAKKGTLWPHEDIGGGLRPVLTTNDLKTAYRVGEDLGDIDPKELDRCSNPDGTIRWQELSYCQNGSGKGGRGRRAKENRVLAILRAGDVLPILVTITPGSLTTVVPWIKRFAAPAYRHEVTLGLRRVQSGNGIAFAQVNPKIDRKLSPEQGEIIRQCYALPLAAMFGGSAVSDELAGVESPAAPALPPVSESVPF